MIIMDSPASINHAMHVELEIKRMSLTAETKAEILELAQIAYRDKYVFFNENEFKKDLYAIFIIKKMIGRFLRTGVINDKLIMNNIIISLNTFESHKANRIFRLALTDEEYAVIKSFLIFLDVFDTQENDVATNAQIDEILRDTAIRFKLRHKYV